MHRVRRFLIALLVCMSVSFGLSARQSVILSDDIKTLQVYAGDDWESLPVITLGTDEYVSISFDQMSYQYHRYVYSLKHCDAGWEESDLYESDYMDGFNAQPVEDYCNSLNTTIEYTHYRLRIPDKNIKPKLSGNYVLTVTDSETGEDVVEACFSIVEPLVGVSATVSGNTDIDTNDSHQQLDITVSYPSLRVSQPERELITVVVQNRQDAATVYNPSPTYVTPQSMRFIHNKDLIFNGGAEFRRFEIIDMYDYTQGVDHIDFHAPYFHATLLEDSRRREYLFDMDHNGRYLIRRSGASDSDIQADYLFVHFSLRSPHMGGGSLYLDGDMVRGSEKGLAQMTYNSLDGVYENTLLLKEGAYDYRYFWEDEAEDVSGTSPTEGDNYETANEYAVYVYFRQRGSRYDRLVGLCDLRMSSDR